ncbi:MAG: GNAT family N-acetyltransferase [Clostridia bacterium]|nr:GNAT family N-acetyltransferase [Clostridia bacterium]
MIFRLPEPCDETILHEYVLEHQHAGESGISASLGLSSSVYSEWLEKIRNNASAGNEDWGRSLLYLCFDGNRLVGLLSIRYELPKELSGSIGDIGYGVRPSERNKGYATAMLRHALSVCREKGMKAVILGCYKDNTASAATIRKNGGVLTDESCSYNENKVSQYYTVTL